MRAELGPNREGACRGAIIAKAFRGTKHFGYDFSGIGQLVIVPSYNPERGSRRSDPPQHKASAMGRLLIRFDSCERPDRRRTNVPGDPLDNVSAHNAEGSRRLRCHCSSGCNASNGGVEVGRVTEEQSRG